MSLNLKSSGGGSVTVDVPSTASNYTATLPAGTGNVVVNGINGALVSGTSVASTSGTSIDFTGIPSWVKRITVMFSGVSTNGSAYILTQLGTSGGVETTSYVAMAAAMQSNTSYNGATITTGFGISPGAFQSPTVTWQGSIIISNLGSNIWVAQGCMSRESPNNTGTFIAGSKTLSGTLDRVRITTSNGTDTFDAGSINILYE